VGMGSSAWRTSLGQCLNRGRVQAIGRRHLTTRISAGPIPCPPMRYGPSAAISLAGLRCRDARSIRIIPSLSTRRHNSSNIPSKSTQNLTATTTSKPSEELQTTSQSPPKSILSRLSGLISLKGTQTTGETGYSSVAKLVELAKPEKKQLAMAVGLVSSYRRDGADCVAGSFEWCLDACAFDYWETNRFLLYWSCTFIRSLGSLS
jgi:hypothetical protein